MDEFTMTSPSGRLSIDATSSGVWKVQIDGESRGRGHTASLLTPFLRSITDEYDADLAEELRFFADRLEPPHAA